MTRRERFAAWWHSDIELDAAPWCRPKSHIVSESDTQRVMVTTTYGYHVIAALLYAAWRRLTRSASQSEGV